MTVTAAGSAPRSYPLCGNPTPVAALVEAHVAPTKQHPKADVVVWLCLPCAAEVSGAGHRPPTEKGELR